MIDINNLLAKLNIPIAEDYVEVEEGVDAPFLVVYSADPQIFYADGVTYHASRMVGIELYMDRKNQDNLENRIEQLFIDNGLGYTKEEGPFNIANVNLYMSKYEMEI